MSRTYYVYILTNVAHTVLYTGVTGNLARRVDEHKAQRGSAFARRYRLTKLVYSEEFEDAASAIAREKQIKAGPRRKKVALIEGMNRDWRDLHADLP